MDCVLFASPVHIVTAWPIAPQKQGYNIERVGGGGQGGAAMSFTNFI